MLDFYAFFIRCGVHELTFLTLVSLLGARAWFLCLFYSMRGAWAYLSDSGISRRRSCLIYIPFLFYPGVRNAWFLCLFYSMRGAWTYLSDSGISIRRSCFCVEPRRVLAARDDRRRESSFEALSTTPAHMEKMSKKVVFIHTTVLELSRWLVFVDLRAEIQMKNMVYWTLCQSWL